jgi:hypothetical protein
MITVYLLLWTVFDELAQDCGCLEPFFSLWYLEKPEMTAISMEYRRKIESSRCMFYSSIKCRANEPVPLILRVVL